MRGLIEGKFPQPFVEGLASDLAQIELNSILQSKVKRITNQRVSDGYFIQTCERFLEISQIVQVEIVPRVQAQTKFQCPARCQLIWFNGLLFVFWITGCIWFRVQFNAVCTTCSR